MAQPRKKPAIPLTSATPLTTGTKARSKKVASLSELPAIIEPEKLEPVLSPVLSLVSDLDIVERFTYVTSHNLRRSIIPGYNKHGKIILSDADFRTLTNTGFKNGVTWDEVLRGLIAKETFSFTPFADIAKFIPQL